MSSQENPNAAAAPSNALVRVSRNTERTADRDRERGINGQPSSETAERRRRVVSQQERRPGDSPMPSAEPASRPAVTRSLAAEFNAVPEEKKRPSDQPPRVKNYTYKWVPQFTTPNAPIIFNVIGLDTPREKAMMDAAWEMFYNSTDTDAAMRNRQPFHFEPYARFFAADEPSARVHRKLPGIYDFLTTAPTIKFNENLFWTKGIPGPLNRYDSQLKASELKKYVVWSVYDDKRFWNTLEFIIEGDESFGAKLLNEYVAWLRYYNQQNPWANPPYVDLPANEYDTWASSLNAKTKYEFFSKYLARFNGDQWTEQISSESLGKRGLSLNLVPTVPEEESQQKRRPGPPQTPVVASIPNPSPPPPSATPNPSPSPSAAPNPSPNPLSASTPMRPAGQAPIPPPIPLNSGSIPSINASASGPTSPAGVPGSTPSTPIARAVTPQTQPVPLVSGNAIIQQTNLNLPWYQVIDVGDSLETIVGESVRIKDMAGSIHIDFGTDPPGGQSTAKIVKLAHPNNYTILSIFGVGSRTSRNVYASFIDAANQRIIIAAYQFNHQATECQWPAADRIETVSANVNSPSHCVVSWDGLRIVCNDQKEEKQVVLIDFVIQQADPPRAKIVTYGYSINGKIRARSCIPDYFETEGRIYVAKHGDENGAVGYFDVPELKIPGKNLEFLSTTNNAWISSLNSYPSKDPDGSENVDHLADAEARKAAQRLVVFVRLYRNVDAQDDEHKSRDTAIALWAQVIRYSNIGKNKTIVVEFKCNMLPTNPPYPWTRFRYINPQVLWFDPVWTSMSDSVKDPQPEAIALWVFAPMASKMTRVPKISDPNDVYESPNVAQPPVQFVVSAESVGVAANGYLAYKFAPVPIFDNKGLSFYNASFNVQSVATKI